MRGRGKSYIRRKVGGFRLLVLSRTLLLGFLVLNLLISARICHAICHCDGVAVVRFRELSVKICNFPAF